jgi:hypothetical protein
MKTYTISEIAPATIIVQHLVSGDYDFSACLSIRDAAEEICSNIIAVAGGEINEGDAYGQALGSLAEYTRQEALEAASRGYGWPIALGFVIEHADA